MRAQLFKEYVDKEEFFNFIKKIGENFENNKCVINQYSFKKAKYLEILQPFLESIKNNYYISKQHYVTREMTFTRLLTIIRQICNSYSIPYVSSVKYSNSSYDIHYTIFITS